MYLYTKNQTATGNTLVVKVTVNYYVIKYLNKI